MLGWGGSTTIPSPSTHIYKTATLLYEAIAQYIKQRRAAAVMPLVFWIGDGRPPLYKTPSRAPVTWPTGLNSPGLLGAISHSSPGYRLLGHLFTYAHCSPTFCFWYSAVLNRGIQNPSSVFLCYQWNDFICIGTRQIVNGLSCCWPFWWTLFFNPRNPTVQKTIAIFVTWKKRMEAVWTILCGWLIGITRCLTTYQWSRLPAPYQQFSPHQSVSPPPPDAHWSLERPVACRSPAAERHRGQQHIVCPGL